MFSSKGNVEKIGRRSYKFKDVDQEKIYSKKKLNKPTRKNKRNFED